MKRKYVIRNFNFLFVFVIQINFDQFDILLHRNILCSILFYIINKYWELKKAKII
jgi:hypothetical protein